MKTIRAFILRNRQIFITGIVIGVVFLLIITVSSSRKVGGPELAPSTTTSENEPAKTGTNPGMDYEPKGLWNAPIPPQYYEEEEEEIIEEPVEEPKEILEITFDDNGFSPAGSYALLNQTVKWTNKTDKSIYIKQMKDFFPEMKDPVEVYSGGSLELKLTKLGVWGYIETSTQKMGSIFILKTKASE